MKSVCISRVTLFGVCFLGVSLAGLQQAATRLTTIFKRGWLLGGLLGLLIQTHPALADSVTADSALSALFQEPSEADTFSLLGPDFSPPTDREVSLAAPLVEEPEQRLETSSEAQGPLHEDAPQEPELMDSDWSPPTVVKVDGN